MRLGSTFLIDKLPNSVLRFFVYLCSLLLIGAMLAGCTSVKNYEGNAAKNLTINTEIESGGWFGKTSVELHIYRMRGGCDLDDLGVLGLNAKSVETGLKIGQKTYLKFVFIKDKSNSYSTTEYAMIITPRHGAQYMAEARYANRSYFVRVREVDSHGNIREFERQHLDCPAI